MPKQRPMLCALDIFVATACLVLLGATSLVSAETDESTVIRALLIGRELDLDPSCNANSSDWLGGDKFQQPFITGDPGECCQMCKDTPDCVAWLFKACCDHCWIKDRIPNAASPCLDNDCVSGQIRNETTRKEIPPLKISDKEDPRPGNKQNATEADCENLGKLSAVGAAFIGCKAILKKCSKPKKGTQTNGVFSDRLDVLNELQGNTNAPQNAECRKTSRSTCRQQFSDLTNPPVVDPVCIALLENGPGSSREGCKNKKAMEKLFTNAAVGACKKLE